MACGLRRTRAARSRDRTGSILSGERGRKRHRPREAWRRTVSPSSCCPKAWPHVRSLSPEESALWARVASTIRPLHREKNDPEAIGVAVEAKPKAPAPAAPRRPAVLQDKRAV